MKTGATPRDARSPVATVATALRTTVELRTSRREILRELRRGGPEVIESLVDALQNGEGETALAAAQLLASLATSEADAAARRVLEDGVEDGGEESLPAETAEMLVEELLRRRDPAGRRLARSLLETPRAARLVIHQLNEAQSLWAADLLKQASASNSLSLASEAIGLLSQRRPRRAATAFWQAAENFAVSGPPRATATGQPEPPSGLADFLRQTLPRMSARSLAHLEDDLRRRSPAAEESARTGGGWRESLPGALGRSGTGEAWSLLVAIVETDGARPGILRAFGALGDARSVPILERYIHLEDDRAEAAIVALAEIPGAAGVRALLNAYLNVGNAGGEFFAPKRALLASSLLRDRGARAMAELRARLVELPDQRTLGALIELFPEAATGELARLLPNVDRRGRPQVFRALALLGTTEAIAVLIDALEEPSFRVLARQSLVRIARRDLGSRPESWTEWFRDHDPGSRRRAHLRPVPLDSGAFDSRRTGATPVLALTKSAYHQEEV